MNNNRKILLIWNSLPIRGAFGEVSVRFPDRSSAQRSVHLPVWNHRLAWGELLGETPLHGVAVKLLLPVQLRDALGSVKPCTGGRLGQVTALQQRRSRVPGRGVGTRVPRALCSSTGTTTVPGGPRGRSNTRILQGKQLLATERAAGGIELAMGTAHIHNQAAAVQPYGACKASDVSPTIAPTLASLDLLELRAWSNLDTCAQLPRSHPINPKTSAPLCPGARPGDALSPRSHLEGDSTRDTAPVRPVRREQGLTRPLAAWRLGTRVTDAR